MVNLIISVDFNIDFRSYGNVEYEFERTVLLQILLHLSFIGQRITKHGYLVVNDVAIELITQNLVDYVHFYLHAKLALNHANRSLSLAESRNVGLLAVVLQGLIYLTLIVILFDGDFQYTIDFVWIFK